MPRLKRDPDVHVYCLCGAQWHGRYAIDNPVVAEHYARQWDRPVVCRLISAEEFTRLGFTDRRTRLAASRIPA
jgi:hypothetical protein